MEQRQVPFTRPVPPLHRTLFHNVLDSLHKNPSLLHSAAPLLEKQFSDAFDIQHALTVHSIIDAAYIALKALHVYKDNEVILPATCDPAIPTAIHMLGATPVFADIEPDLCTLSLSSISSRITKQTKVIISTNAYGYIDDLEEIHRIARTHNIKTMLDCSQSLSYRHKQRNVVSCADICISRLQPLLNLPIEGAVCFTQDSLLSERMSGMRSLPTSCNHKSAYSGVESHLDPLLAMLWQQYKMILPVERQHTAIISAYYTSHLKDLPNLTLIDKDSSSSHYIILHPQAKQLQQYLQTCNIHSLLPWQLPVPCQPAFADCLSQVLHLSNLLRITSSALALPLYPELSEQQLLCVVDGVKEFCNNWKGDT